MLIFCVFYERMRSGWNLSSHRNGVIFLIQCWVTSTVRSLISYTLTCESQTQTLRHVTWNVEKSLCARLNRLGQTILLPARWHLMDGLPINYWTFFIENVFLKFFLASCFLILIINYILLKHFFNLNVKCFVFYSILYVMIGDVFFGRNCIL